MTDTKRQRTGRFLVPARNSRHRIACLALYRALQRLAPRISLPDDLAKGWGAGKNPIAIHIERAFRRNVTDTSPRIVHAALSAGYRMLSVLHDAATSPTSPHHASIRSFLHSRLAERQRSLAHRPPPRPSYDPKSDRPHPDTLPLLVRVSPPPSPQNLDPRPQYTTPHRPRPQSALGGTGRRQIPRLDLAGDIPFLRLTKPQPTLLSRVLRQKVQRRTDRLQRMRELWAEALPEAQLEDEWEAEIARLMREEQARRHNQISPTPTPTQWTGGDGAGQDTHHLSGHHYHDEPSHAHTLRRYGVQEIAALLDRERRNEVARADAMRLLIAREKALAAQEDEQRAVERRERWEARMRELHGEGWRGLFPNLGEAESGPVESSENHVSRP